jgi:hypothetical protein
MTSQFLFSGIANDFLVNLFKKYALVFLSLSKVATHLLFLLSHFLLIFLYELPYSLCVLATSGKKYQ